MNEDLKLEVEKALEVLKSGGLILYPTDTLWGIGCDATNSDAVQKIYELKKSDNKKSMLVLVKDFDNVTKYVNKVPDVAWELLEVSENPLTIILPNAHSVAKNLIPEENTLGIRVPKHEFCNQLLRRFNRPIVSTSANISSEKSPLKFSDISKVIIEGVDFVVSQKFEGKPTFKASSIIALDESATIKIIRE